MTVSPIRPETVVFQLENVIGMVEGLPHQTEPHGVNAWQDNSVYHCALGCLASTRPALFVAGPRVRLVKSANPSHHPRLIVTDLNRGRQ